MWNIFIFLKYAIQLLYNLKKIVIGRNNLLWNDEMKMNWWSKKLLNIHVIMIIFTYFLKNKGNFAK